MKKISVLLVCMSFLVAAANAGVNKATNLVNPAKFTVVDKQDKFVSVALQISNAEDKAKLEKLVATLTVTLTCVTIVYTGETAQVGLQIMQAGGGAQLLAYLQWYWCGGGYQQNNPPNPCPCYA